MLHAAAKADDVEERTEGQEQGEAAHAAADDGA